MGKKKGVKPKSEEENTPATTPVTEEKPTEEISISEEEVPEPKLDIPEPKAEVEPTVEPEEEKEVKPEKEPRKGYSKRVRELVADKQKEKARADSLADKVAELTRPDVPQAVQQPTITPQPEQPLVAPGEEIDALELDRRLRVREQRSIRRTDALIQLRGKQQDVINQVNREANEAVRDYPELDPTSESFNKELSETVTEAVEAHIRSNPYNASVKKFVDKLMKPYQQAVTKEVGKVTEDIAKQTSQTALKPTSIRKGEKKAEEKTVAELEAELGVEQH